MTQARSVTNLKHKGHAARVELRWCQLPTELLAFQYQSVARAFGDDTLSAPLSPVLHTAMHGAPRFRFQDTKSSQCLH